MRRLSGVMMVGAMLLASADNVEARARCGNDSNDAAALASVEAAVAAQCDCCPRRGAYTRCVASVVRSAVRARSVPGRCLGRLRRDLRSACPRPSTALACRVCASDADCGTAEFCECRRGSCAATGGVCINRPEVCPDVVAPVCGCNGTTYANDCFRRAAGACKLHDGGCVASGGCLDPVTDQCTGETCSPAAACPQPSETCSAKCGTPPPTSTCFDPVQRHCTEEPCGADQSCLPNEVCLPSCPPPPPTGHCFVTVDLQCSPEACGPDMPCRNPNEFCNPSCGAPQCTADTECDDRNGCTSDQCVNGVCEHACLCLSPTGTPACCPGPAALCARPCGTDAAGSCGGDCPSGATCQNLPSPTTPTCGCASGVGAPCGGFFVPPPPVCAPGLVCQQSNPDVPGICVASTCIPSFAPGCTQTSDCCQPCEGGGPPPCYVCSQGSCLGAPTPPLVTSPD